jgi:hypothetical protein
MALEGQGNLPSRQDQPARGMEYYVNRHVVWGVANGPEYLLRILDIDVSTYRQAHEVEHLLTVNQRNDPGSPLAFQPLYQFETTGLSQMLLQ